MMLGHLSWAWFDGFGYDVLRYLLAIAWHSSLLFAGVAVLSVLLRRRSAAVRHVLWTAALLLAPVLPLAAGFVSDVGLPQYSVELSPRYAAPVPRVAMAAPGSQKARVTTDNAPDAPPLAIASGVAPSPHHP